MWVIGLLLGLMWYMIWGIHMWWVLLIIFVFSIIDFFIERERIKLEKWHRMSDDEKLKYNRKIKLKELLK